MIKTLERPFELGKIINLDYANPEFMMRFAFDRRADYGNVVFELDEENDPRFANLNLFVAPKSPELAFRRLVLINPARYSDEPHAQAEFEKYGVFPAGEHPCEGVMAQLDIRTDDALGYPARLVLPDRAAFQTPVMAEYIDQGFDRHSQYCRTHRLSRLSDANIRLEDPWERYMALQQEHALALINTPAVFRNAPILKMNVGM